MAFHSAGKGVSGNHPFVRDAEDEERRAPKARRWGPVTLLLAATLTETVETSILLAQTTSSPNLPLATGRYRR